MRSWVGWLADRVFDAFGVVVDQLRAGFDDLDVGVVLAPGGEVGDRVSGGVDPEAADDAECD